MTSIAIFCLIMVTWSVGDTAFGPKKLYSMDLPVEAVSVKVIGKELIIVGPRYIGGVSNVHWKFRQSSKMTPRVITNDIANPRSVGKIPGNTFRGSNALTYWVASWGTNDTSGAIYVLRPSTAYTVWQNISIDSGWNYERSQWIDMNRDGRKDCLTARFRGGVGQLLWLSQPAVQSQWSQQIILEGMADGNFIGFVKGRKTYILVAGLQFTTLGLVWSMSRANSWSSSSMVRHRVIDNYGKYYDVQYIDLNKDGRPDVLTTTVNAGYSRGTVLGYEVPDDLQNKIWNRNVLATGFQGYYGPGKATAFWPNKWKQRTDRPSVFLSGAGQEVLFILSPRPATTGWSYVKSVVKAGTGMIGLPYIGDIDGDSYPEVFVPQGKRLHVFSYDYSASVAEPPTSKTPTGAMVKYVPPFSSLTAATIPPVTPRRPAAGESSPAFTLLPSSSGSPVSEEYTPQPDYYNQNHSEYEENAVEPPLNAILSITSKSYAYREEADDACSFQNKVLCTLQMLEASTKAGSIPLVDWGWFSMEGRAAQIQDCRPGDVKWSGFECYNGIVVHSPIRQSAHLKGFCCAVLRGAIVTDRRFSNFHDAKDGCKKLNTHICSLDEMYTVWDKSSYKGEAWGWYQNDIKLIRMVHSCDTGKVLWPGYECLSRKLTTSKIVALVRESAYCCQ